MTFLDLHYPPKLKSNFGLNLHVTAAGRETKNLGSCCCKWVSPKILFYLVAAVAWIWKCCNCHCHRSSCRPHNKLVVPLPLGRESFSGEFGGSEMEGVVDISGTCICQILPSLLETSFPLFIPWTYASKNGWSMCKKTHRWLGSLSEDKDKGINILQAIQLPLHHNMQYTLHWHSCVLLYRIGLGCKLNIWKLIICQF